MEEADAESSEIHKSWITVFDSIRGKNIKNMNLSEEIERAAEKGGSQRSDFASQIWIITTKKQNQP